MMGRVLGIDYGTKRIGLALSDPAGSIASPRKPVSAPGRAAEDAARLLRVAAQPDAERFVGRLPSHMGETDGA